MKLSYVRSDAVYKKIMEAPVEKKNDIYRYELMMPFKGKWDCYQIPMNVFCQVLFPEKSVGIPFFQQVIFPAFSGHYASLRMRACSIR